MKPRALLLGVIAEKDGCICLQTGAGCWYPLGGSSGIAEKFRETFNEPQQSDLGKRLYNSGGILCMENTAQMEERLARENAK